MVIFLVQLNDDHTSGRNMNKQIAEQDKKLAEQDKKISEQDVRIAQQDKKNIEQDKNMAQIVRNVELIQSVVATHSPLLKALSGNTAKYSIVNFSDIIIKFLFP